MFYGISFEVIFLVSKYMSTFICVYAYHTSDILKINKYLALLFKQQNHAHIIIIIILQIFSNYNIIHVGEMFLQVKQKFFMETQRKYKQEKNTVMKHPKVK